MPSTLLLVDLDNTVYNWVDFFAPSFRAMVHKLHALTGVHEDEIYEQFREVYKAHGSLEYNFSIQELALCRGMNEVDLRELVERVQKVYGITREKNIRKAVYEGVADTLRWANESGILVVAATNSPLYHAQQRLKQLGLLRYFSGIVAWEGPSIPDSYDWEREIRKKEAAGGYQSSIQYKQPLTDAQLKPSPMGYLRAIKDLGAAPETTFVVGDSLRKDLVPAIEIGAVGIWASYGGEFDSRNWNTLLRITHWSEDRIEHTYDRDSIEPTFVIERFDQLRRIIPTPQLVLDFEGEGGSAAEQASRPSGDTAKDMDKARNTRGMG